MTHTAYKIIQIGDVILKRVNQTDFPRTKKQSVTNNQYADGSSVNNFLDLREDLKVRFTCSFDPENFDKLERLRMTLDAKQILVYFVRYEKYDGEVLKSNVIDKNIVDGFIPTFYMAYGRCVETISNDYATNIYENTDIEVSLVLEPKLYRADEYLSYLPKENESLLPNTLWGGGANWSSIGITWGQFYTNFVRVASLTPYQLLDLLDCDDCGCVELQNLLIWNDIYVKPFFNYKENYLVRDASVGAKLQPYTFINFTDSTKNQNLQTVHPLFGIRDQKTVIVEITRKNASVVTSNSLLQNETIEFANTNNGSGFKLKWLGLNNSPSILQVRFDNCSLYDVTNGKLAEIDFNLYSLEALGDNNESLYFKGGLATNKVLQPITSANLKCAFFGTLGTNNLECKIANYITTY